MSFLETVTISCLIITDFRCFSTIKEIKRVDHCAVYQDKASCIVANLTANLTRRENYERTITINRINRLRLIADDLTSIYDNSAERCHRATQQEARRGIPYFSVVARSLYKPSASPRESFGGRSDSPCTLIAAGSFTPAAHLCLGAPGIRKSIAEEG